MCNMDLPKLAMKQIYINWLKNTEQYLFLSFSYRITVLKMSCSVRFFSFFTGHWCQPRP